MDSQTRIQRQWQAQKILYHDAVVNHDGRVTLCECYCTQDDDNELRYYWHPICDTTVESIEKYIDDKEECWADVTVYPSEVAYGDDKIVCGAAVMGNQGFVACVNNKDELNWSICFDFAVPINNVEIDKDTLNCYGNNNDGGVIARIDLKALPTVVIDYYFVESIYIASPSYSS